MLPFLLYTLPFIHRQGQATAFVLVLLAVQGFFAVAAVFVLVLWAVQGFFAVAERFLPVLLAE